MDTGFDPPARRYGSLQLLRRTARSGSQDLRALTLRPASQRDLRPRRQPDPLRLGPARPFLLTRSPHHPWLALNFQGRLMTGNPFGTTYHCPLFRFRRCLRARYTPLTGPLQPPPPQTVSLLGPLHLVPRAPASQSRANTRRHASRQPFHARATHRPPYQTACYRRPPQPT